MTKILTLAHLPLLSYHSHDILPSLRSLSSLSLPLNYWYRIQDVFIFSNLNSIIIIYKINLTFFSNFIGIKVIFANLSFIIYAGLIIWFISVLQKVKLFLKIFISFFGCGIRTYFQLIFLKMRPIVLFFSGSNRVFSRFNFLWIMDCFIHFKNFSALL